jgi:uncharacterized spore protein YtfJ
MNEISTQNSESKTTPQLDANPPLNTVQTTMDKFLSAANVDAVYGPPIREGENIVIPAAEVLSVAGFGFGAGSGHQGTDENENVGNGEGGGGGGRVLSRPVAAIVISPTGVRVEPIVDVTKIALALFTTLGFMAAMLTRMRSTTPPKFQ